MQNLANVKNKRFIIYKAKRKEKKASEYPGNNKL